MISGIVGLMVDKLVFMVYVSIEYVVLGGEVFVDVCGKMLLMIVEKMFFVF